VRLSIASPLMQPSPNGRRVGIRIVTFEACSGFTHVTAHRIAQPPKATFVTRLQPFRSPGRTARQLPDQSTTLWVDSSSTGNSRLRGALPLTDSAMKAALHHARGCFVSWRRPWLFPSTFSEYRPEFIPQFDPDAIPAHDDALLNDRQGIVPSPVD
jgi:hypothetical protein